MQKQSQFHSSRISPWDLQDSHSYSDRFSPHRRILTPHKRQAVSSNSSKRESHGKNKIKANRTVVKMTKINISTEKSAYPKPQRDPFNTYTPKNMHIGIFQKTSRRQSPQLSPRSLKKNTIMTIDTWRQQSKRILSQMSKRRPGDWRYSSRENLNKTLQQRSQKNNLQLLSKFLQQSSLGDSLLIYKKQKVEHPNLSRFKMLQLQKKIKL